MALPLDNIDFDQSTFANHLQVSNDMTYNYASNHYPHQASMLQYNQSSPKTGYPLEPAPNPFLFQPTSYLPEGVSNSVSMSDMLPLMPSNRSMAPHGITLLNSFPQAPVSLSSSHSQFHTSLRTLKPKKPSAPISSLGKHSEIGNIFTQSSGGRQEYNEGFPVSPVNSDNSLQRSHHQASRKSPKTRLENAQSIMKQTQFKCNEPGCRWSFKYKGNLTRHMTRHSKERPYICRVPGCHRTFTRTDTLKDHYTSHSKRGGRHRYVASLDPMCADYDPAFFYGQFKPDGRPLDGHSPAGLIKTQSNK
ncbi:hypothetical protein NUU61_001591 [Penicillium alfredii]|uniref:C2H2-type domain-containing protein n=1 Tax=Penicillium alfredii TaxID=1506179 RepID=A0A9W9G1C8_9EURO|nr:uncharacterized protein NUU61_001591 [Penicillium alfredii]KAJ5110334.1 hypothetical protein NUU61_001591 [Penicillium alfredii]